MLVLSLLLPACARRQRAAQAGPSSRLVSDSALFMVQVIPQSSSNVTTPEGEGGGGNRISEEQIKSYLEATLGEAPRPSWGVPQGWGNYLAGA